MDSCVEVLGEEEVSGDFASTLASRAARSINNRGAILVSFRWNLGTRR